MSTFICWLTRAHTIGNRRAVACTRFDDHQLWSFSLQLGLGLGGKSIEIIMEIARSENAFCSRFIQSIKSIVLDCKFDIERIRVAQACNLEEHFHPNCIQCNHSCSHPPTVITA